MKTFYLLLLALSSFLLCYKNESKVSSKYICSAIVLEEARCTGSSNCSVCSSCSRCAHCSNGGTCGICIGSTTKRLHSDEKVIKKSNNLLSGVNYSSDLDQKVYLEYEFIFISRKLINLREEPNKESKVIENLHHGDVVTFLTKEGEWSKVKSNKTEVVGYVLTKLLN